MQILPSLAEKLGVLPRLNAINGHEYFTINHCANHTYSKRDDNITIRQGRSIVSAMRHVEHFFQAPSETLSNGSLYIKARAT